MRTAIHPNGRRAIPPHAAMLTVMPDATAHRDLGLDYWNDDALAIIAKGFQPVGSDTSVSQGREVQP